MGHHSQTVRSAIQARPNGARLAPHLDARGLQEGVCAFAAVFMPRQHVWAIAFSCFEAYPKLKGWGGEILISRKFDFEGQLSLAIRVMENFFAHPLIASIDQLPLA